MTSLQQLESLQDQIAYDIPELPRTFVQEFVILW